MWGQERIEEPACPLQIGELIIKLSHSYLFQVTFLSRKDGLWEHRCTDADRFHVTSSGIWFDHQSTGGSQKNYKNVIIEGIAVVLEPEGEQFASQSWQAICQGVLGQDPEDLAQQRGQLFTKN